MNEEWNDKNNKKKTASSDVVKSLWLGYRFSSCFMAFSEFYVTLDSVTDWSSADTESVARHKTAIPSSCSLQIMANSRVASHLSSSSCRYIYLITSDSISKNEFFITEIKSRFAHFFLARSEFSTRDWNSTNDGVEMENRREASREHKKSIFIARNVNARDYH